MKDATIVSYLGNLPESKGMDFRSAYITVYASGKKGTVEVMISKSGEDEVVECKSNTAALRLFANDLLKLLDFVGEIP